MSATHDRIELNMIEDDTRFYFDLYEKIKEKEVAGFILLGFLPYLSLYVLEA